MRGLEDIWCISVGIGITLLWVNSKLHKLRLIHQEEKDSLESRKFFQILRDIDRLKTIWVWISIIGFFTITIIQNNS